MKERSSSLTKFYVNVTRFAKNFLKFGSIRDKKSSLSSVNSVVYSAATAVILVNSLRNSYFSSKCYPYSNVNIFLLSLYRSTDPL
jgi:hypothetical protein